MAKKASAKRTRENNTDKYIANSPREMQGKMKELRAAIRAAAPGATERTDYFQWPGYSYDGYDYDGMFAWFSFKEPNIRLHVRPPVIQNHKKQLAGFATSKAVVFFTPDKSISMALARKLVKASIKVMKDMAKAKAKSK